MNRFGPDGITKAKLRRRDMGAECIALDGLLDAAERIRSHAGATVEDAIDSREADASLARDVLERERYARFSPLHRVRLAEA
jgi:hypothetical protein